MSGAIQVDRFTRQNQSVTGTFLPSELPRLAEYLAGDGGEIAYALHGSRISDAAGSQKHCIKCIISGWFLVADPATLKPVRHDFAIDSKLILVASEADMPPLEMESDDEDYVVCGNELDVLERVEEEILLDLPATLGGQMSAPTKPATPSRAPAQRDRGAATAKISPFAKLAELKKK
ncbi:MAG: YceD family protein [Betaproteobacteria bacterium]